MAFFVVAARTYIIIMTARALPNGEQKGDFHHASLLAFECS